MSEPEAPPPPPKDGPPPGPPPEPPQETASTPPPPAAPQSTNTVMVVLSYLWILALVPLLVEKDDKEVQWHAKHGLVLLGTEIIVWIALTILVQLPILGILGCLVGPLLWLAFLVVHVVCIVKGVGGGRFTLPYVSQYADKF